MRLDDEEYEYFLISRLLKTDFPVPDAKIESAQKLVEHATDLEPPYEVELQARFNGGFLTWDTSKKEWA